MALDARVKALTEADLYLVANIPLLEDHVLQCQARYPILGKRAADHEQWLTHATPLHRPRLRLRTALG